MSYMIGTGYWSREGGFHQSQNKSEFFDVWYDNTIRHSSPQEIIVVNHNSTHLPRDKRGTWIDLKHNHGHIFDEYKTEFFVGWTVGFLTGAMIALANHCDFIYKEQDCLAFNGWVDKLYADAGDHQMVMGTGPMDAEISLVLVKEPFLKNLIGEYLLYLSPDRASPNALQHVCCEHKFAAIERKYPNHIKRFSMGVGRERPIIVNEEPFYAQKIPPETIKTLYEKRMISSPKEWKWFQ